mmetsp:Transcript_33883/g.84945  ORF Transcript_33883/g.84945 Transcript_33883/m.84945 type:complete len:270 (+) Transcript_33883:1-810(+)
MPSNTRAHGPPAARPRSHASRWVTLQHCLCRARAAASVAAVAELLKQRLQRGGLRAQDLGSALKLLPQHVDGAFVDNAAEVVVGLEGVLDADEVALRADALGPALLRLGEEAAAADADDSVAVVVPPGPVLEKRPHQLRERLGVGLAKAGERGQVVAVVAAPLAHGAPEGERLRGLQARQHRRRALLQQVDDHQHVAVAGQRAAVGLVDLPALGPVLDHKDELPHAGVHGRVVSQQLGVDAREVVVHGDVALGGRLGVHKLDDGDARVR